MISTKTRLVAACVAFAGLSACATEPLTTTPTADQMLGFMKSDGTSALVINTGGGLGCGEVIIGLNRDGDKKNTIVITETEKGYATSRPAVVVVPPGHYTVNRASCTKPGYYPMDLPLVGLWFGDVNVAAGELVYVGTLMADKFDVRKRMGVAEWAAAIWLVEDTGKVQYPTYEMQDASNETLARLRISHPEIADRMISRIMPALITAADFEAAFRRAYAPGSDGQPPAKEEIDKRLDAELDTIIEKAIAAMKQNQAELAAGGAPTVVLPPIAPPADAPAPVAVSAPASAPVAAAAAAPGN